MSDIRYRVADAEYFEAFADAVTGKRITGIGFGPDVELGACSLVELLLEDGTAVSFFALGAPGCRVYAVDTPPE